MSSSYLCRVGVDWNQVGGKSWGKETHHCMYFGEFQEFITNGNIKIVGIIAFPRKLSLQDTQSGIPGQRMPIGCGGALEDEEVQKEKK